MLTRYSSRGFPVYERCCDTVPPSLDKLLETYRLGNCNLNLKTSTFSFRSVFNVSGFSEFGLQPSLESSNVSSVRHRLTNWLSWLNCTSEIIDIGYK